MDFEGPHFVFVILSYLSKTQLDRIQITLFFVYDFTWKKTNSYILDTTEALAIQTRYHIHTTLSEEENFNGKC